MDLHLNFFQRMALIILCVGCLQAAQAEEQAVGTVRHVQGDVRAISPAGEERLLQLDDPAFPQDRIVTADGASVLILFADESVITMGAGSEMVIDQYAYDPGTQEEGNGLFKMVKGMFRVVTGKIVRMNPDRFKVQTGRSIIGIRGCEILLQITPQSDRLFVVSLPDGHSIVVESLLDGEVLRDAEGNPVQLVITEAGEGVLIGESGEMRRHTFSPAALERLMRLPTLLVDPSAAAAAEAQVIVDLLIQELIEEPDEQPRPTPAPTPAPTPLPPKPDPDYGK